MWCGEMADKFSAGVVKLVDIPDLGSGAARHGGSSPSTRTKTVYGLMFKVRYSEKECLVSGLTLNFKP